MPAFPIHAGNKRAEVRQPGPHRDTGATEEDEAILFLRLKDLNGNIRTGFCELHLRCATRLD